MRLPRTVLALVVALTSATVLPTAATADSATFPAGVDSVVLGDLEAYEWMLPTVNATAAHTQATGAGVTVAVIDTGVDSTHPDLENQVVPGAVVMKDPMTGKLNLVAATDVTETAHDWYGHGSHVSGIIAADDDGNGVTGVAPDADVMPIDLLPKHLQMSDVTFWRLVSDGIDYAVAGGASVINMSLGGPSSGIVPSDQTQKYLDALDKVCDSVAAARDAGTVVVAAAGNEGVYGNPQSVPASCDGAIAVAALDSSLDRTFWSSYDAAVDVAAPGQDILSVDSTVADESLTAHLQMSGTSMASPVVAGVAALVVEQNPGWTPQQVQDQITGTARDLGVAGRDPEFGWGAVDAAAAVGAAAPPPAPQNFFATWSQESWGTTQHEGVVSWTPPSGDPVSGYTLTVYDSVGTATYSAGGDAVRLDAILPVDSWYTLTATTTSGDVTTYPAAVGSSDGHGEAPSRLKHASLDRRGDTLTVSWDRPQDPDSIDVIEAVVYPDLGHRLQRIFKIDQTDPFPRHIDIKLPRELRWADTRVLLFLTNKDDNGHPIGERATFVDDVSPALYGSRILGVDRAGSRLVEVSGGMSNWHERRVCGRKGCAGLEAVLLVDRGSQVERIDVTFTSRAVFHQLVATDKGDKALKVRIEGPKSLDSGPWDRVSIR